MRPVRLRPPLWARWALSLGVGALVLLGLVLFVTHNNSNSEATQNPAAVARANRQAEILIGQDQAPHTAAVAPGASPRAAILRAVRTDMAAMIATGTIDGSLRRSACTQTHDRGGRRAFRCTVLAGGVSYPFFGVVDVPARRVTYCKRDAPPVPSLNIPLSSRCTAV